MKAHMADNAQATIDPKEAAHFGAMAADWWDPQGSSAMLHKLNPVRLRYIRAAIDQQWPGREKAFRPLEGQRALDVGCGAGLLTEPLARLGASVTGLDAAPENIAAALSHAESQGQAEQLPDLGHAPGCCHERARPFVRYLRLRSTRSGRNR